MRSKIIAFAFLVITVCSMSSCLNDDNTEVTFYDDTAITSFSLGNFVYNVTLKAKDGKDSIVSRNAVGTNYPVFIDQTNHRIYNVDSLPVATDMKHMLVSAYAKNGGSVLLKKIGSDSLQFFSSTDSLDFSVTRELTVYSQSGLNTAKYTVDLVAHKEYADSFEWKKLAMVEKIAAYKAVKTVAFDNHLYLLGKTESGAELLSTPITDGKNWADVTSLSASLSDEASIIASDNSLMVADKGTIYTTADGVEWSSSEAQGIKTLVGFCNDEVFALSDGGEMLVSLDGGKVWNIDKIDEDKSLLPALDVNSYATQTLTNKDIARIIMVGARAESDTTAVVWSKIVEQDKAYDMPWSYQEFAAGNGYKLPNMEGLTMTSYNGQLFAIGGKGRNGSSVKAFSNVYISNDCGITWHTDDARFAFPDIFKADNASIVADGKGYIWIIATGSGQVWRGKINKLAWANK
ncbi:MAG: DUF6242 domain-containing protein [Prevotella sp.]|nr:DUF6242 domain-containing protein [Prevotella sp.]